MPILLMLLTFVLAEIAGFILVGEALGVLATLGLVVLGLVVGVLLLRRQGIEILVRVRADLAANRAPTRSLAHGAMIAAAALLIAIPGFVSDIFGLLLLIPAFRDAAIRVVRNRFFAVSNEFTVAEPTVKASPSAIVDLDQSEYGARPRPDTPWRGPEA